MATADEWKQAVEDRRLAGRELIAATAREAVASDKCAEALEKYLTPVKNGNGGDR